MTADSANISASPSRQEALTKIINESPTKHHFSARQALEAANGKPVGDAGSGGSIPLLRTLEAAAPQAEFILWGPEDVAAARIHASDESVDPSEIEKMVVAQALLIQLLAERE